MAFQFPWTNLHELNLDWFLSKFKQFTDNFLSTTATAESVPYGTQPSVTVTGGELDEDTDVTDPFTFNFKIPAGQQGEQGEQGVPGVPGQDGFSPIATVTKSGTVATITITDVNGTTSTTISDGEVTQAQLDTKAPAILPTVSGSIANFPDGADDIPVADLVVNIEPVQSGSGDPAPDNVRPITGWTGCNVTRTGKNLLPFPYGQSSTTIAGITFTINDDGSIKISGTATGAVYFYLFGNSSSPIPSWFKPNTKYFWHVPTTPSKYFTQLILYGSPAWSQTGGASFTTPSAFSQYTGFAAVVGVYNGASVDDTIYPMLELGSTATAYEPYQSNTVNLSWQTEAGTVYGGSLDVTTGVLTVEYVSETVTGNSTIASNGGLPYGGRQIRYTPTANKAIPTVATADVWCDRFKVENANLENTVTGRLTDGNILFNMPASCTTFALSRAWFNDNNTQIVFKLATPQTYQLTPQEVRTLLGTNNIFSDCSSVEVEYRADTKLYIEKLTMPTEDDMVANSAISSGSFFMIGNTLYRATTAIASGSQIIPGTNATPMSLADALNLL